MITTVEELEKFLQTFTNKKAQIQFYLDIEGTLFPSKLSLIHGIINNDTPNSAVPFLAIGLPDAAENYVRDYM